MPGGKDYLQKIYQGMSDAYGNEGGYSAGNFTIDYDAFSKKMQDSAYAQKIYGAMDAAYGKEGGYSAGNFTIGFDDFYQKSKFAPAPQQPAPVQEPQQPEVDYTKQDPIDLAMQADELSQKTNHVGGQMGAGSGVDLPDEASQKKGKELKDFLKQQGYDADQLAADFKDYPKELFNDPTGTYTKERLLKLYKENPEEYRRTVATAKWQSEILKGMQKAFHDPSVLGRKLSSQEVDDDWRKAQRYQTNEATPSYDAHRQHVRDVVGLIYKYTTGDDRDRLLKYVGEDMAYNYGNDAFAEDIKKDERSKYLNPNQIAALHFLEDTQPDVAKGYDAIMVDPKSIKGNVDATAGWEAKASQLEQIGLGLQINATKESLGKLIAKAKESGNVTPEQEQQGKTLQDRLESLYNEYDGLRGKYPTVQNDELEQATRELIGEQEFNPLLRAGAKVGQGTGDIPQSIWDFVSEPFRSNEGSKVHQLEIAGHSQSENIPFYLSQKNQLNQSFIIQLDKSLMPEIERIKADESLSWNDKYTKIYKILKQFPDKWAKVAREKTNLNPASLMYSVTDLAATLVPFMAVEGLTGGGATASVGRKILSTFTAAAVTSFHENYAAAIREGAANPYERALTTTAIMSAAMAGAGTPDIIRGMLGTKTAVGELVSKMTDDEIAGVLKASKTKQFLQNMAKAGFRAAEHGFKGGVKFEAAMVPAKIAIAKLDNKKVDAEQLAKEAGLGILNFTLLGVATEPFTRANYKALTDIQKGFLYRAAEKPEEMLATADDMFKRGVITKSHYDQIKTNVEKAAEVKKTVSFVNNEGEPLNERDAAELLAAKTEEAFINDELKKDQPEKVKERLEGKLVDIKDRIREVREGRYKGQWVDIGADKAEADQEFVKAIDNKIDMDIAKAEEKIGKAGFLTKLVNGKRIKQLQEQISKWKENKVSYFDDKVADLQDRIENEEDENVKETLKTKLRDLKKERQRYIDVTTKKEKDAVQKQGTDAVDVRNAPADGEEVGTGDTKPEEAAGESKGNESPAEISIGTPEVKEPDTAQLPGAPEEVKPEEAKPEEVKPAEPRKKVNIEDFKPSTWVRKTHNKEVKAKDAYIKSLKQSLKKLKDREDKTDEDLQSIKEHEDEIQFEENAAKVLAKDPVKYWQDLYNEFKDSNETERITTATKMLKELGVDVQKPEHSKEAITGDISGMPIPEKFDSTTVDDAPDVPTYYWVKRHWLQGDEPQVIQYLGYHKDSDKIGADGDVWFGRDSDGNVQEYQHYDIQREPTAKQVKEWFGKEAEQEWLKGKAGGTKIDTKDEVFEQPENKKNLASSLKQAAKIPIDAAKKKINEWKEAAKKIGKTKANNKKVVISLFDYTGMWTKGYHDAGYVTIHFDLQHSETGKAAPKKAGDLDPEGADAPYAPAMFDPEDVRKQLRDGNRRIFIGIDLWAGYPENIIALKKILEEEGYGVDGVLAAPPCTSFAASGAQWWKEQHDGEVEGDVIDEVLKRYGQEVLRHFDSPLEFNTFLVNVTEEWFRTFDPKFYAMENPQGRIKSELGLPDPTLTFNPNNFGDPYTKETQLWGKFNNDLPTANVDPTDGSKMQSKLGSRNKVERSATPEGFAYSFFMANHSEAKAEEAPAGKITADDITPAGTLFRNKDGEYQQVISKKPFKRSGEGSTLYIEVVDKTPGQGGNGTLKTTMPVEEFLKEVDEVITDPKQKEKLLRDARIDELQQIIADAKERPEQWHPDDVADAEKELAKLKTEAGNEPAPNTAAPSPEVEDRKTATETVARAFDERFGTKTRVISAEEADKMLAEDEHRSLFFSILDDVNVFDSKDPATAKEFITKVFLTVKDADEAKRAFRKLAVKYHPDKHQGQDLQRVEEIMKHLNDVYERYQKGTLRNHRYTYRPEPPKQEPRQRQGETPEEKAAREKREKEAKRRAEARARAKREQEEKDAQEYENTYKAFNDEYSGKFGSHEFGKEMPKKTFFEKIFGRKSEPLNWEKRDQLKDAYAKQLTVREKQLEQQYLADMREIAKNYSGNQRDAKEKALKQTYMDNVAKIREQYKAKMEGVDDAYNKHQPYRMITKNGKVAGFYNPQTNESFIIYDRADDSTPIHEIFTHPFLEAVSKRNQTLYRNLLNEAKANRNITRFVDNKYRGASQSVKNKEYIARAIDLAAKGELKDKTLLQHIQEFWNEVKQVVKDLFGLNDATVENISAKTTIKELSDFVLKSGRKLDLSPKERQAKPEEKGLWEKLDEVEEPQDPRSMVLHWFQGKGNALSMEGLKKIFSGKKVSGEKNIEGEKRARISLLSKKGKTPEQIAHAIWDNLSEEMQKKVTTRDLLGAVEEVIIDHTSKAGMAKELVDKYHPEAGNVEEPIQAEDELTPEEADAITGNDELSQQVQDVTKALDGIKFTDDEADFIEKTLKENPQIQSAADLIDFLNKPFPDDKEASIFNKILDHADEALGQVNPEAKDAESPEASRDQAADSKPSSERELKAAERNLTRAKQKLADAEEKISKNNAKQGGMFGEAEQGGMFGIDREEAKKILDPLREEVKKAQAEYDQAKKKYEREKNNDPDQGDMFEQHSGGKTYQDAEDTATEEPGKAKSESDKKEQFYEEVAGARPKRTNRIPVDPIVGAIAEPLGNIMQRFGKAVKAKILYATGKRRNAAGSYTPTFGDIKLRWSGDLDTEAHEMAHLIDDRFNILGKARQAGLTPELEAELKRMSLSPAASQPQPGHPDPKGYRLAEGWAEWLRAYIVNPTEAITQFPEIFKLYDEKVNTETKQAVEDYSKAFRIWAGSSAGDKVMSNIEWKPEDKGGFWSDLFKKREKGQWHFSWLDKLQANFTDPMQATKKMYNYLRGLKGIDEVLPENHPYILARLFNSVDRKFGEFLERGWRDTKDNLVLRYGKPLTLKWLIEPLDNTDSHTIEQEMQDVLKYMVAERTIELSKKFGRNTILTGIGGGIFTDVAVAKETLNEFEYGDQQKLERIKEAAKRYRIFANQVLKYMLEGGRISQEQYDLITDNNLQYVAMKRIVETEPGIEYEPFRSESSGKLGSSSELIYNIHGSTRKIANPYLSLMDTMHRAIKETDRNNVLVAIRNMLYNPRGMYQGEAKDYSQIATLGTAADRGKQNVQTIFVNGKPEYWIFNHDIFESLKGLSHEAYKFPKVITFLPKLLRGSVTHFPTFAIRNIIRDTQARLMLTRSGSNLWDLIGNKEHWHDVARNGGLNTGYYMKDKAHYYGLMQIAIHDMAKKKNVIVLDHTSLVKLWKGYENMLAKSETSNRVAEYRAALRKAKAKGMDDFNAQLYAAFKSRELIDFSLMGYQMKWINQIIPFSNAAVQGIRSAVSSYKINRIGFVGRMMLYGVMPSVINWIANHNDPETAEEYEEKASFEKDMFYNFKIGKNLWLAIPKPFELALPGAGAERMMSYMYGNKKAWDGYAGSVLKALSPIDQANIVPFLQPEVEAMFNKDMFRDKAIVPQYEEKLDLSLRHTERGSRLGQLIQEGINVDSRKIDHIIKGHLSYWGGAAIKLSNIGREDDGEKFGLNDTGLTRQSPAYNSVSVQEFLKFAERFNLLRSPQVRNLQKLSSEYFATKADDQKEEIAKEMRRYAKEQLEIWEAEFEATGEPPAHGGKHSSSRNNSRNSRRSTRSSRR